MRLWDTKTQETISVFDHGHPVEDVLVYPGGTILVSAGSNEGFFLEEELLNFLVKIWDLLAGKLVQTLSHHQKTVTSLGLDYSRSRLFSGSLVSYKRLQCLISLKDQQIKVYSTETYEMLHNMKYPGPIMSLGLSPASSHLVVGMSDGILSIR